MVPLSITVCLSGIFEIWWGGIVGCILRCINKTPRTIRAARARSWAIVILWRQRRKRSWQSRSSAPTPISEMMRGACSPIMIPVMRARVRGRKGVVRPFCPEGIITER
ncbi:MAG: hypothetical protein P8Y09_08170 [Deltaproteobacteria bacterium]